jgi:Na+/melibiose symporter-like transporter
MTVFFDLASTAYVPAIVPQVDWVSANSQMEAAQQTIAAGGPGLAGLLISAISAPTTLLVNAVTFLASAILVFPTREPPLERVGLRRNAFAEALEGLRYLLAHAGLLRITLTAAISNVGLMMVMAVNLLFLYRVLELPAFVVGLSFAAGSLASVIGALFNQRIVHRLGVHGALLLSTLVEGLGWLLVPFSLFGLAIPVVVAGMVVSGFFNTTWNVGVVTYRQRNVPLKLMGRVGAGSRMIGYGALPLGSLLGGLLGQALVGSLGQRNGLALTLVIGAAVAASSAVGLLGWRAFDRQPAPATSV